MKKKSKTEALDEAIILLENKQALELKLLKDQFNETLDSLKPGNLIQHAISNVSGGAVKNIVVSNAIGLGTGYLLKKAVFGGVSNPIMKVAGSLLQYAVAGLVSSNSDSIQSVGKGLLSRIFGRKQKAGSETQEAKQHLPPE